MKLKFSNKLPDKEGWWFYKANCEKSSFATAVYLRYDEYGNLYWIHEETCDKMTPKLLNKRTAEWERTYLWAGPVEFEVDE
jgi:hypothetical protein